MSFKGLLEGMRNAATIVRLSLAEEKARPARPLRSRHEVEFLPAAVEALEAPPSPTARWTFWALFGLFAVGLAWSFVGELDVVAVAQGRTIPAGRSKVVQPLEPGVVRAIHVQDGQTVKAGEVLVELDPTSAASDVRRLSSDLVTMLATAARLKAALHPDNPLDHFQPPPEVPASLVDLHRSLLLSQTAEHTARLAALDGELARRTAEGKTVETAIARLEKALPLLRERTEARETLAEQGWGSRLLALELRQQYVEHEHELKGLRHRREQAIAALEVLARQRNQVEAEYAKTVMTQLTEAERRIAALTEELLKAEQQQELRTLTAPIDGIVQQLAVHTVGGVVTPAQPLLVVVPAEAPLEIEALVLNRDIGFVQPGQPAEIKLETFLFTKYGTIPGHVAAISRDAVSDEKLGLVYPARIALDRSFIEADGRHLDLGAGMALTVEIKTDRRRVIDYLLSPLLRYSRESLRER